MDANAMAALARDAHAHASAVFETADVGALADAVRAVSDANGAVGGGARRWTRTR